MRNDPYQPVSACQVCQRLDGLAQGFLIKGAKALVHEHGIQTDSPGRGLNLISQAQRQRKRSFEGFSP